MPNQPYNPEPIPPSSLGTNTVNGVPSQWPQVDNAIPFTADNLQDTNLVSWGQTVEYMTDMGLRSSPVAAAFQTKLQAFWRCHAGRTWKVISAVGIASVAVNLTTQMVLGDNPPIPSPDTQDDNDVLVDWRACLFTPQNYIDGQQLRGLLVVLVYSLQKSPILGVDVLDFGASPFDKTPAELNIVNPQDFYQYLSKSSGVQGFNGGSISF